MPEELLCNLCREPITEKNLALDIELGQIFHERELGHEPGMIVNGKVIYLIRHDNLRLVSSDSIRDVRAVPPFLVISPTDVMSFLFRRTLDELGNPEYLDDSVVFMRKSGGRVLYRGKAEEEHPLVGVYPLDWQYNIYRIVLFEKLNTEKTAATIPNPILSYTRFY